MFCDARGGAAATLFAQRGGFRTDGDAALQIEDDDAFAFPLLDFESHGSEIRPAS